MIRINLLGQQWKIYLLEEDKYIRKLGDDSAALTETDTLEIFFNAAEFTLPVVRHELCHAAYKAQCVYSANLKPAQIEEVFCEILEKYGDKLIRLSRKIYKELKDAEED